VATIDGQAEEQTRTPIHDQNERAAKTLLLALAALYVVGFLIVAFHLAGFVRE
jgi:hypothetical protein